MRVTKVKIRERYRLELSFNDGVSGVVDVGDLAGQGVFTSWLQPGAFEDVSVGSGGELVWTCGVDLCADALYLRLTGKKPGSIFPSLLVEETIA